MCPGCVKTRHEISFLKFDRAGCAVSHDRLSGKGREVSPDSATFRVFTQPVPTADPVALRWESIVGHKRALRLKLNGQIGIALNIALQWMLEDFIMWWFPDLPKCITAPAVSLTFVGQTTSGSVRQADKLLVYLHFNRSRTVLLRAVT
jgi:hypothetical protein